MTIGYIGNGEFVPLGDGFDKMTVCQLRRGNKSCTDKIQPCRLIAGRNGRSALDEVNDPLPDKCVCVDYLDLYAPVVI